MAFALYLSHFEVWIGSAPGDDAPVVGGVAVSMVVYIIDVLATR